MNIEQHHQYLEGQWAGKSMIENIENTTYGSIENAIKVKQQLINHFEENFGYSREMDEFDSNYVYNVGILDVLLENLA